MPDETQITTARENTINILREQGSIASNKTLFVNSRATFYNQTCTSTNQSKMGQ